MLDIHKTDSVPNTKIYFTHSLLPSYIDPQNVSTKKQPFTTFNAQPFTHTLSLLLPSELYPLIASKLEHTFLTRKYARVHLKLSDILASDFLTTYLKQGRISMLSEGRPLIDNHFSLHAGILRLELDRPTYERCGLHGTPIEDGGKKHQKQRWIVTFDLSAGSMQHGKKGFGRLEWACKNVLNQSLTWLFYNYNESAGEALVEGREVVSSHAPWVRGFEESVGKMEGVSTPRIGRDEVRGLYGAEEAVGVLEWLDLLGVESPRVREGDVVDAHLCRYEVPDLGRGVSSRDFVQVRWRGFIVPELVREVFLCVRGEVVKLKEAHEEGSRDVNMQGVSGQEDEDPWFSMSAQSFCGKKTWTIMQFDSRDTLTWETDC